MHCNKFYLYIILVGTSKNFKSGMNMAEQKTILVFGAMDVETEFLISSLGESNKTVIGGYPFYEGFIDGKKIKLKPRFGVSKYVRYFIKFFV